jgi:hypothetical protein
MVVPLALAALGGGVFNPGGLLALGFLVGIGSMPITFALLMIAARTNRSMRVLAGVQAAIVLVSAFGYFPSAFLAVTDLFDSWM